VVRVAAYGRELGLVAVAPVAQAAGTDSLRNISTR
jgi:hypothetical protein